MLTLKASLKGLELIREARAAKGWPIDDERWLENARTFLPTYRSGKNLITGNVSIGTWRRFYYATRAVKEIYFKAFCKVLEIDWKEVTGTTNSYPAHQLESTSKSIDATTLTCGYQDWREAPDVSIFQGRSDELLTLKRWIVDEDCRLVAIQGMAGVGKTYLSVKLGRELSSINLSLLQQSSGRENFEYIIWRKLLNAPTISDLLVDLISFLSSQQTADMPSSFDDQVLCLLHYLREHRCLIILDNFESILLGGYDTGQYQKGYEAYGQLIKYVGEAPHISCFVITSREKPQEVRKLPGKTSPIRLLNLKGLTFSEGRDFLADFNSLSGSDDDWKNLIELYDGNPLALELTANHIDEVFFGNISEFLKKKNPVFKDLRVLLDWHLNRLTHQEREIVYWLAIERKPISLQKIEENVLFASSKNNLTSAIQSLQERFPIQKLEMKFTLQAIAQKVL